jgi:hypothetical protein
MSRATSAVESCASSGPAFAAQTWSDWANRFPRAAVGDREGAGHPCQELLLLGSAGEAPQIGTLPDPAWIEADQIEVGA